MIAKDSLGRRRLRSIATAVGALTAMVTYYGFIWDDPALPPVLYGACHPIMLACAVAVLATRQEKKSVRFGDKLADEQRKALKGIASKAYVALFGFAILVVGMLAARALREVIGSHYGLVIVSLPVPLAVFVACLLRLKSQENALYRGGEEGA